jgi:glutathione S-transferase
MYDKEHKLLPAVGDPNRYEALQWVHAAEGTWALHGLSILYARWFQQGGDVKETEKAMSKNVNADMRYLEEVLSKSSGNFIFGEKVSVADTLMHFSAVFILARELGGATGKEYPKCAQYIKDCEATDSYKRAVEKTGHNLSQN